MLVYMNLLNSNVSLFYTLIQVIISLQMIQSINNNHNNKILP